MGSHGADIYNLNNVYDYQTIITKNIRKIVLTDKIPGGLRHSLHIKRAVDDVDKLSLKHAGLLAVPYPVYIGFGFCIQPRVETGGHVLTGIYADILR